MKLETIVLFITFEIGKCLIPSCEEEDSSTLCTLEEDWSGPPKPWPLKIDLDIEFRDLIEVDERKNSVKIMIMIYQSWNDSRLVPVSNSNDQIKDYYDLDLAFLKDVWHNEPYPRNTLTLEKFKRIGSEDSTYL